MQFVRRSFVGSLLFVLLAAFGATLVSANIAQAAVEEGFEPLFPGGALTGWVAEQGADFKVDGNEIHCGGEGDYPSWLRSEETFENFVLRFDFRLGLYGEGGIFLHAPRHGRNATVGFEVQLSDDNRNQEPATISSGAIFGAVPPRVQATRPLGEWNEVEVVMDWPKLQVTVNGQLVQDLNVEGNPELRYRLRSGYLGLQDRGAKYSLRNVRIKRLAGREKWQSLFNGKNFDGWAIIEPEGARWSVQEGVIVAEDGNGYLMTQEEYQDFEFHTYVRTTPKANGGVFFRWKSLIPKDRGNEIQIEDVLDSNNPTGSIYDLSRGDPLPVNPGEWYLMQIRVEGPKCLVRVNGKTVAQTDKLSIIRAGHIALQMHRRESVIHFAEPKIKLLVPDATVIAQETF